LINLEDKMYEVLKIKWLVANSFWNLNVIRN
jgi:hypothetical protein